MDKGKKYCTIEFDGDSKGNPGRAGSGAVLRDSDGNVIYSYREGLGNTKNNIAEYRGLICGLDSALEKMPGEWQLTSLKMAELYNQAKEFASQFKSFDIDHISREYNSEADSHANYKTHLQDGQTQVIACSSYY